MADKDKLLKMIKSMEPGQVMMFVSQELEQNPAEFLLKHAGSLALKAVKNGWTKGVDLKNAIKDLSQKSHKDDTGIDWSKVKIDEDTMQMACLFDGQSKKKLKEFAQKINEKMKEFAEEKSIKEAEPFNESKLRTDKLPELVTKKSIDAIIKAGKTGGKIANADGDGYVTQTGDVLAKTILKRDFPDEYEKIESLSPLNKKVAWQRLGLVAHAAKKAAKTGSDSEIQTTLRATGLGSLMGVEKAADAADDIANVVKAGGEKLAKAGKNSEQIAAALKSYAPKNEKDAMKLAAKLVKKGAQEQAAEDAVRKLCQGQDWFEKLDTDDQMILKDKIQHATFHPDDIEEYLNGGAEDVANAEEIKDVVHGFNAGKEMAKAMKDMGLDNSQQQKLIGLFARNAGSSNSMKMARDKVMQNMSAFNMMFGKDPEKAVEFAMKGHNDAQKDALAEILCKMKPEAKEYFEKAGHEINGKLDSISSKIEDVPATPAATEKAIDTAKTPEDATAAAGESKPAAQQIVNDEEAKKAAQEQTGMKKMTALGWARLVAKTTGCILNYGKDLVDAIGERKIKNAEDKNVIAEIRTLIDNAEGSDKDYSDSQFSIRFTTDDFKWHATCLDDRKMQLPEDVLVKKVLSTKLGKLFKQQCLKIWTSIFKAQPSSEFGMVPSILKNIDKFGLSKASNSSLQKIKAMSDNFDQIAKQFK